MTAYAIVRVMFVAIGLVSSLDAQVQPPSSAPQVSAIATPRSAASRDALPVDLQPHRIIYGHVLRQIADFGHRAEALEAQGKDPGIFRDLLPKQTGVTPSVASYITQLAYQYEQEMAVNQARVKQAVTAFRQAHKGGIDAGNPPPIPDPELQALDIERTNLTEDYVARLQALLGEEAFERFDDKVRTNIVSGPRYGLRFCHPGACRMKTAVLLLFLVSLAEFSCARAQEYTDTGESAYGYTSLTLDASTNQLTA